VYRQVSPGSMAATRRPIPAIAMLATLLLGGAAAVAQPAATAPAGQEPNWEAIRKAALSPIDRGTVQKWVAAKIDELFAAEDPAKPGPEFSKKLIGQVRDAAPQFKDALCQVLAEAFVTRYQQAAGGNYKVNPLAPVFVLMTLRECLMTLREPNAPPPVATLPAFAAVIGDPAPAVRREGIMGINVLRAALSPAARTNLIEPVRKAAMAETCPTVLIRLYDFLKYVGDNPAQGQDLQIAQTLVALLDARLTRVEKEGEWPAIADAEAVNWLAAKSRLPSLNNAQIQKDIVRVTARLLVDAAWADANLKPPQQIKQDLERIVILTEDPSDADHPILGLVDLYKTKVPGGAAPSPSVSEAASMATPDAKAAADQKAKIAVAITKWVGSEQTKGLLNDAFGLPIGLGIQRPAPPPSSAPAS
jgi:hypothetical protein